MTWSVTSCDKLKYAIAAADTAIEFNSLTGTAELAALIGTPATKHVAIELYNAAYSEQVIAYASALGKIKITRANAGTTARVWPVATCVRTLQVIDGGLTDEEASDCGCDISPWDGFTVCSSFVLDKTVPTAPTLCLKPTGVVAGTYCGLKVNEFGQVTFIPSNYPASCLPVFDPCDDCGGGGGGPMAGDATSVAYMPQIGSAIVIANNVQLAIEQLEDYINANVGGSVGVTSVTGTSPIVITGSATEPIVGHATSSLSAGTYGGFTVDSYGHITGYSATTSAVNIVAGTGIVAASSSPGVWDISTPYATSTLVGGVSFIAAGAFGSASPISTTLAVSYGNLTEWWTTKLNFICSQPVNSPLSTTDKVSMCQSGNNVLASLADIGKLLSVPHARLILDGTSTVLNKNIASVTPIGQSHVIAMAAATSNGEYHVIADSQDGIARIARVTLSNSTSFVVDWVNPANPTVPIAPPTKIYITVMGA